MNTEKGELAEISERLAREISEMETNKAIPSVIFRKGEILKIEGKRGTFEVVTFGKHFIKLKVLPIE